MISTVSLKRALSRSSVGVPSYAPSARKRLTGLSIWSRSSGNAVVSPTSSGDNSEQIMSPVARSKPRCSLRQDLRFAFVYVSSAATCPCRKSLGRYCPRQGGSDPFFRLWLPQAGAPLSRDAIGSKNQGPERTVSSALQYDVSTLEFGEVATCKLCPASGTS